MPVRVEDVKIPTVGGVLECVLRIPDRAYRAVVFAPGLGQDARDERFTPLVEVLMANTFTVLQMNYRNVAAGVDKSELTLQQMAEDMKAAYVYLKRRNYKRVGLVAKSVSSVVFFLSDLPFSAVALWGPVIYPEREADGYLKDANIRDTKLKDLQGRRGFLKRDDLHEVKTPVLVVHGSLDEVSPVTNAQALVRMLPNARLHLIEGSDHGFHELVHMAEAVRTSVEWFNRVL